MTSPFAGTMGAKTGSNPLKKKTSQPEDFEIISDENKNKKLEA